MSVTKIKLQTKTNSLLNWLLQPKSLCLNQEKEFVTHSMFESVCASYSALEIQGIKTNKREYHLQKIDDRRYNTEFLYPVLEISKIAREELSDLILNFILHGSLSTYDFVPGWSDFDSMVVIKNNTLEDSSKMMKLRSLFFNIDRIINKIDKHQHHGIHFITEKDLLMYPSIYLPPDILGSGVSLIDSGKITLFNRDSREEEIDRFNSIHETFKRAYEEGVLRHHEYNGEYLTSDFKNYQNAMYQLKYFLSVVVILPSYFMNILKKYPDKRSSIRQCKDILKSKNFEIIDRATEVRNEWTTFPVKDNQIPQKVMDTIGEKYFLRGYNLIDDMKKYLGI